MVSKNLLRRTMMILFFFFTLDSGGVFKFLFIKFQEGAPDDLHAQDRESGVFIIFSVLYLIE